MADFVSALTTIQESRHRECDLLIDLRDAVISDITWKELWTVASSVGKDTLGRRAFLVSSVAQYGQVQCFIGMVESLRHEHDRCLAFHEEALARAWLKQTANRIPIHPGRATGAT